MKNSIILKKMLITINIFCCIIVYNAQQWDGANNTINQIYRNGSVSIGTNQNIDKLNILGNLRMINGELIFGYKTQKFMANSNFKISFLNEENLVDSNGIAYSLPSALYLYPPPYYQTFGSRNDLSALVIGTNYKIGMGTDQFNCNSCSDYRLFVKDGIKTEKIKVEIAANNGWADYVFNKDYKLTSLKDLQIFINKNGHLPEVPTTNQVLKDGIELKEMNILLLKKIEELTLYILNQQTEIDEQNLKIKKLEKYIKK
ncbi:MAG: hypothetical protein JST62_00725 [Bacteroidetes bacterium]|nr:hypothetical protein [Bacteroidota bacterium]